MQVETFFPMFPSIFFHSSGDFFILLGDFSMY
jgi:hypothetical protein